jgi:hypothetical protein
MLLAAAAGPRRLSIIRIFINHLFLRAFLLPLLPLLPLLLLIRRRRRREIGTHNKGWLAPRSRTYTFGPIIILSMILCLSLALPLKCSHQLMMWLKVRLWLLLLDSGALLLNYIIFLLLLLFSLLLLLLFTPIDGWETFCCGIFFRAHS